MRGEATTLNMLQVLREHVRRYGYPPTLRELGRACGLASTNGVRYHLRKLEEQGAIERVSGRRRGITLCNHAEGLPVLGRVVAGEPLLAEENVLERLPLDPAWLNIPGECSAFGLQVHGDSMRDAGILAGDYAIVRFSGTARDGEIVVARLNGETTVKQFRRRGDRVQLVPAHPDYPIVEIADREGQEFQLVGVVTGVVRCMGKGSA